MAVPGKAVSELAMVLPRTRVVDPSGLDPIVVDVTHDSRQCGKGILFVAIRGERFDGHEFVQSAVDLGSDAVCVDHEVGSGAAEMVVENTRTALGPLAASVHGDPSKSMNVIGVTGTNGKTTVTHYVEAMGRFLGLSTGLIGTIVTRIGDESIESVHTTPEASDFQRLLAMMRDRETQIVAVEVSSHALEMGRVASTRFGVAAFTNLSQDHLDFHGDMEAYRSSKKRLFDEYEIVHAVFNIDDVTGREFANAYSGVKTSVGSDGDVSIASVHPHLETTSFDLRSPWGSASISASVVGRFNVDNAVMAATCLLASGTPFDDVANALESLSGVPGRYELISGDDPIRVVVDYAHTPVAIEEALEAARELGSGRVLALIGAGGDRDRGKRPLMGEVISAADIAIITSDNPRSEDPAEIIASIVAGLDLRTDAVVELDRVAAIDRAIELAEDGDVVLILGRGHEPMQEINGAFYPLDDRELARAALERRRRSTDSGDDSGSMGL
ncbi:MAG: UDP-N-acetylmuramoyl-L-alanyl-D-glutamate--2,6-diaminopimelate ligase [Actinomycetota bacterium]|nr:UDP-N-acetylmuramoyl-L-alanyl-D-glutamate--2,6-diaminopimelate ligase [Actinomycetota bacterium]